MNNPNHIIQGIIKTLNLRKRIVSQYAYSSSRQGQSSNELTLLFTLRSGMRLNSNSTVGKMKIIITMTIMIITITVTIIEAQTLQSVLAGLRKDVTRESLSMDQKWISVINTRWEIDKTPFKNTKMLQSTELFQAINSILQM